MGNYLQQLQNTASEFSHVLNGISEEIKIIEQSLRKMGLEKFTFDVDSETVLVWENRRLKCIDNESKVKKCPLIEKPASVRLKCYKFLQDFVFQAMEKAKNNLENTKVYGGVFDD